MQNFKTYILIFFSAVFISLIGKSNSNGSVSTFSKFSCHKFIDNYSSSSKIRKDQPVNTYVRNRRSIREDDHKLFSDATDHGEIYAEKPIIFKAPYAEQRLFCYCTDLIPSRAPPATQL